MSQYRQIQSNSIGELTFALPEPHRPYNLSEPNPDRDALANAAAKFLKDTDYTLFTNAPNSENPYLPALTLTEGDMLICAPSDIDSARSMSAAVYYITGGKVYSSYLFCYYAGADEIYDGYAFYNDPVLYGRQCYTDESNYYTDTGKPAKNDTLQTPEIYKLRLDRLYDSAQLVVHITP